MIVQRITDNCHLSTNLLRKPDSMQTYLSTIFLVFFFTAAFAQDAGPGYVDVVHLYRGDAKTGTVITYEYGERVVLVGEDGRTSDFAWDEVKRVNFRLDKDQVRRARSLARPEKKAPEVVIAPPARRYWHQVDAGISMGVSSNGRFGSDFNNTTIGGGLSYHYVRKLGRLRAGLGADVSIMSHRRRENVLAGTGLVEYPLGRGLKRMRSFVRFQGGITYPFGAINSEEEITARRLSPLYHPSVGFEFTPPHGGWGSLMIDIGYRFLNSRFDLTTATLDVVERRVVYRRLVLRGGFRF